MVLCDHKVEAATRPNSLPAFQAMGTETVRQYCRSEVIAGFQAGSCYGRFFFALGRGKEHLDHILGRQKEHLQTAPNEGRVFQKILHSSSCCMYV